MVSEMWKERSDSGDLSCSPGRNILRPAFEQKTIWTMDKNQEKKKLHVTNPSTVQRVQYTIFTKFSIQSGHF